jgi:branched-chain amino acid transport system permease protein
MLYREAGQYKTSYAADMAVFPLRQDRWGVALILAIAFIAIPLLANDFVLKTVMLPFLIFALAAIGLNILTGYTGLISLGTAGFMGVGAIACYKLTTYFPDVSIIVWILASGLFSAAIGVLFGLPSLRIKGFYLAVATLAAQFFLQWCFIRIPWTYNHNPSGAIEVPTRTLFGVPITGATGGDRGTLPRGADDRRVPDVDRLQPRPRPHRPDVDGGARHGHRGGTDGRPPPADEAPGLRRVLLLRRRRRRAPGIPVARWGRGRDVFTIRQSFLILFMVIIGGLGSLIGSFLGAAVHLGLADDAEVRAAGPRRADRRRHRRARQLHANRGADRVLPDRRAARARAPVADREAEAAGLALPLLKA